MPASRPDLRVSAARRPSRAPEHGAPGAGLDLQQLALLVLEHLVDLLDRRVRDLLELLLGSVEVVLREVAVLLERFEVVTRLPTDVAHRHPTLLGAAPDDLHEIPAPLLGQRREHESYDVPVVGRVD